MARQERCLRLLDKIDDNDIAGVKGVLQYDVDLTVDRKGDTPMHSAARKGSLQILKLLVAKGGDANLKNLNGYAPIHYAARDGRMDIVCFLLECGANPNTQNKEGDAPIHELVKVQPMDVIEEMVSLGMNVNLQNKMGRTPLHIATRNDRHEATELLLTCGADGNIKDEHGKTAEELCRNPELANRMRLHDVMMEAFRKGYVTHVLVLFAQNDIVKERDMYIGTHDSINFHYSLLNQRAYNECVYRSGNNSSLLQQRTVKAQGVSLRKTKKMIELKRVGIVVNSFEVLSKVTPSFYCRREKSENTTLTLPTDNGDEMVSDVFYLKISDVQRSCHVSMTVPMYGLPKDSEELFVRYQSGMKETVTTYGDEIDTTCTFTVELFPECFSICALYTCAKTDQQLVGKDGAVITSELDDDMKIEIPPNTFDDETKLSIKVYSNNESDNGNSSVLLTDIYSIHTDTGNDTQCDSKQNMTLTLPTHANINKPGDIMLLTLNDITDNTDEDCIEVLDSVVKLVGKTLVYEIPHFSIHVAVPRACYSADKSEIYKRLVSATERQRTAVFFVVVRGDDNGTEATLVVVECCAAEKASRRLKKWKRKGYQIQSPEMSGSFMLKPYREFGITFRGIQPPDASDKRKIAFLPRRPSYQPYRISTDDINSNIDGTVYIRDIALDQKDKGADMTDRESLTAIPFTIKLQIVRKHKEEIDQEITHEELKHKSNEETTNAASQKIYHSVELEEGPTKQDIYRSSNYAKIPVTSDQTDTQGGDGIYAAKGNTNMSIIEPLERKTEYMPKTTTKHKSKKDPTKKTRKPFLYPE